MTTDEELWDLAYKVLGELHLASDVAVAHLAVQERGTTSLFWATCGQRGFIPSKDTGRPGFRRVIQ